LPKFLSMSKPTPTLLWLKGLIGIIVILKRFKQIEQHTEKKTNHEEKSLQEGKIAYLSF